MKLSLRDIARAIGANAPPVEREITGWSVDTRTLEPGDLYFALRGENQDGHQYVAAAMEKGAAGAVVERPCGTANELLVADTLRALQYAGAWARQQWGGTVVAVTGSAGKTTTKDAIAHLLGVDGPVGKTVGNFNNHIGVPLSILRLPAETRIAVLEMGMNHAGELSALGVIARPDIAVVTNVGYAHVEFFESIDGVAAAKRELIEALPASGVAVLNADDPRVARFREIHSGRTITFGFSEGADVRAEWSGPEEREAPPVLPAVGWSSQAGSKSPPAETGGATQVGNLPRYATRFRALGVEFETALTGRHGAMNLLAAIAVAQLFGIAPGCLREAVRTFETGKMRGERMEHAGIVVWNDCYNSNPEAAESMIEVLRQTPAARRIAVLGEMLELGQAGEDLHRRVGRFAAAGGIDLLIGVRGAARVMVEAAERAGLAARYFEEPAEAGACARAEARAGDAVLFKGSRGVKMERALERFVRS